MERSRLALAAAILSGALVAVQTRVNAELAVELGDALLAAVVSFAIGLAAVVIAVLARRSAREALPLVRGVLGWQVLGGFGGAALVAVAAYATPEVGVALLSVAIVAGQTSGGLLVDRLGVGPGGVHGLTGLRILAALLCLLAVGVGLTGDGAAKADPVLLGLAVGAGVAVAFQAALNGRVRRATGNVAVATLVNFVVGLGALLLAYLAVGLLRGGWAAPSWPGAGQWVVYTGGLLGAAFVAVAAAVVRVLGVLRLGLAVIAGQLLGAVLLDVVLPATADGVAVATLVGVALTFVALTLTSRSARAVA